MEDLRSFSGVSFSPAAPPGPFILSATWSCSERSVGGSWSHTEVIKGSQMEPWGSAWDPKRRSVRREGCIPAVRHKQLLYKIRAALNFLTGIGILWPMGHMLVGGRCVRACTASGGDDAPTHQTRVEESVLRKDPSIIRLHGPEE